MFSVAATAEYLSAIMAGAATAVQKSSDGSRLLISWGCSSAAFFLILTGTQLALKRLRITTARPPFAASMIGVFAVATAGVASSRIFSILYYDSPSPTSAERKQRKNLSKEYVTFCATASLIVYYALGGRARSVAPSDRIGPGAFARLRHSIPALKGEMVKLNILELHVLRNAQFHADHQPPSAKKWRWQTQRYYPQCKPCSSTQGGLIAKKAKGSLVHINRVRPYHLWLPVPLLWVPCEALWSQMLNAITSIL